MNNSLPPTWKSGSIFAGIDTAEFARSKLKLRRLLKELQLLLPKHESDESQSNNEAALFFERTFTILDEAYVEFETLKTFLVSFTLIDFNDRHAESELSQLLQLSITLSAAEKHFIGWLNHIDIHSLTKNSSIGRDHEVFLRSCKTLASHLLSDDAESIISALQAACVVPWSRLHTDLANGRIPHQCETLRDGKRDSHPPESERVRVKHNSNLRKAAYKRETNLFSQNIDTFTAALNAVKGFSVEVCERRGWLSVFEETLFRNGITLDVFEGFQEACYSYFVPLRRYLKIKARCLGKESLSWYDIDAPTGEAHANTLSWDEAQSIILGGFSTFNQDLAKFTQAAIENRWLDLIPRPGKRVGSYCLHAPGIKQSRILTSFRGRLDDVLAVAHELGHAYHYRQLDTRKRSVFQRNTPLPLAEVAGLLAEQFILDTLKENRSTYVNEKVVLEESLSNSVHFMMDTYACFLFEDAVFKIRRYRELLPNELSIITSNVQKKVYGDVFSDEELHPFVWVDKLHNFAPQQNYHNYPYTMGYLISLSLLARYKDDSRAYSERYADLLSDTGRVEVNKLLSRTFDINLEDPSFWLESLPLVARRVNRYEEVVKGGGS